MVSLTVPTNARGPILDLVLPASEVAVAIIVRNYTTGKSLTVNLPEKWDGKDLSLDWFRRTIKDSAGVDRSALLSGEDNGLWEAPAPVLAGVANDVRVEALGFNAVQPFIKTGDFPNKIATDATYIYYADYLGLAIGRATLAGGGINNTFISTGISPAVAVDAGHIYFTPSEAIGRATLAGGEVNKAFIAVGWPTLDVAVNATNIYWVGAGLIGRATLAGGSVNKKLAEGLGEVEKIALTGTYLYAMSKTATGAIIWRARLDGSELVKFLVLSGGAMASGGLAVDANYLYFADQAHNRIGRIRFDGSAFSQNFYSPVGKPTGLALDAEGNLYWSDGPNDRIGKADPTVAYAASATFRWEKGYF